MHTNEQAKSTLLLHTCCGPCSTFPVPHFREAGWDVTGLWYNPNVHPYQEHQKRRESMAAYAAEVRLPMLWCEEYEMPRFLAAVAGGAAKPERCAVCYQMRLERTAAMALERGFQAFSTTLLVSPYQDHALLRGIGEKAAQDRGVRFLYQDLRKGWAERSRLTRQFGLYRQQYCGCIYSEWERYREAQMRPTAGGDAAGAAR